MNEQYKISPRLRMIAFLLIAIGIIGLGYGVITYKGEAVNRVWANLLLDSIFFLGISIGSAFFIAASYLAWAGWWVVVKRVAEAIIGCIPFCGATLLIVLIFGQTHIFHWAMPGVMDPKSSNYDAIIAAKSGYLNNPFFFARFFAFLGTLWLAAFFLRKTSIKEDSMPAGDISMHKRSLFWASIFIPVFAVYILVTSWDWAMSIDTHWYSTMFGWYSFGSFWVTSMAVLTLVVLYLKSRGYLKEVNDNHLHNLGLFMFAFSIFWTYLTFDQYMLIWYANLPEETIYFQQRYAHFSILFYLIFIFNFCAPFLILMSRDSKRNPKYLIAAALFIIVGHFIDFYLMVMPGTVGAGRGFGPLEAGLPCLFIGVMILITATRLANAPMIPKNSPHLQESLQHEI